MGEPSLDTEGRGDVLGGKEKGVEGDSHVVGIELPSAEMVDRAGADLGDGRVPCGQAERETEYETPLSPLVETLRVSWTPNLELRGGPGWRQDCGCHPGRDVVPALRVHKAAQEGYGWGREEARGPRCGPTRERGGPGEVGGKPGECRVQEPSEDGGPRTRVHWPGETLWRGGGGQRSDRWT